MTERSIASRPSLEQVSTIIDFMEKHPALGSGQLRGLEGRDKSKKLWMKLTRIVNNAKGPTRPMKSWIKYWADKKSTVRYKVMTTGDPNNLTSNFEKRIWDLFLANDCKTGGSVKQETHYVEESYFEEDSIDQNYVEVEPVMAFEDPVPHDTIDTVEERQTTVMEKLVKVMDEQASALAQMAHAAHVNAQAMERLADASQIQARALDRLAGTFDAIGASTHDVRNAIVDIEATMKRFYTASPT